MKHTHHYSGLILLFVSVCMGLGGQAQSWQHAIALEYDVSYVPKWNTFSASADHPAAHIEIHSLSMGLDYTLFMPDERWKGVVNFNFSIFCYMCFHDLSRDLLGWPSRTIPQGGQNYTIGISGKRVFQMAPSKQLGISVGPSLRLGGESYYLGVGSGIAGTGPMLDDRKANDWGLTVRISYDKLRERLPHMKKVPWHKYFGWSIWLQGRYYFLMRKYYRWPDEFVTGAPTTFSLGVSLRYYFGIRE